MSGAVKPYADGPTSLPDLYAATPGERVIIALLTEIRDALVPPAVADLPCAHPEEARRDMSSMGETEWICRACKYHYGPVKKERPHAATLSQ